MMGTLNQSISHGKVGVKKSREMNSDAKKRKKLGPGWYFNFIVEEATLGEKK